MNKLLLIIAVIMVFTNGAIGADWPMWGGEPTRNMINKVEKNIPTTWDIENGRNIKWVAKLGSQTYGNPVISNGKIFVGTNNQSVRQKKASGDKGVIMCFRESDGKFLWQLTHDKLPAGRIHDWPQQGICSSPCIEGDRMYYVSNRCQLICADVEGFLDRENDGPFKDEKLKDPIDGDIIWSLDMLNELGVFPHNLATSSPVIYGDLIFVVTGNGVDEGHIVLPVPMAPSFIAVNKHTGEIVWENADPMEEILHGQWSSPSVGVIDGVRQAIFPGGDGRIYSFAPDTGDLLWKFQCNPADSVWKLGGMGTRNNIIATPVIYENKVFISVGQDPEHGEGPGHLYAMDGTKRGDIAETGVVWHNDEIHRSMSTVAIYDGILYTCDLTGIFRSIDPKTGKTIWTHDLLAAVWSSPMAIDGKVYIGDEDGDIVVFRAGRKKKILFETNMINSVYTTPVAANGVLYITNRKKLFAIAEGTQGDMQKVN